MPIGSSSSCTPGMGVNLWGESPPVREPKGVHMMNTIKSTSRRQGRFREEWSEGSRSAKVRTDEQQSHHPQAGTRKQWGRARTRIGHLINLGFPRHQAILTGLSRKGYWHLARTFATNCGLSKEYLQDQRLVSIRALWIGIHYPATAR